MEKLIHRFDVVGRFIKKSFSEKSLISFSSKEELINNFPHKTDCSRRVPLQLTFQNIFNRPIPGQWMPILDGTILYYLTCKECNTSSRFDSNK